MLDFSKFKKTAEDDKTVTMRHEKGHEMRVLLKALRPIEREQIKRIKMADGGKVQKFADNEDTVQPADAPTVDQNKPITINVGTPQPQAPVGSAPIVAPVQAPPAIAPNFNPAPSVVPSPNTGDVGGAAATQERALQLRQQAGNDQQIVDTAKAQGSVPLAQQQQNNADAAVARGNNSINDLQRHAADMDKYLTNPKNFDPRSFYQNMGVPQKISTALGLILGGFKQGVAGGNNPAADWLKDQQEKDINAQKMMADNHRTVWGAYRDLYGDENIATEMAKKSWMDKLAGQANELTARLGTPQAAIINKGLQADALQKGYESLQKASFLRDQGGASGQPQASSSQSGGAGASVEPSGNKKPAYGPESADKEGIYNLQPHITPDADAILKRLQQRADAGDPAAKADLPVVMAQLADSRQREALKAQAAETYRELVKNATSGGHLGRNVGHTAGAIGGAMGSVLGPAGAAAGAAIGEGIGPHVGDAWNALGNLNNKIYHPDERSELRKEEDYGAARSKLADYISKLYPGSSQESQDAKLRGIMPDKPSDRENIIKHLKTFEDLATAGGKYDALKRHGMYKD